MNSPCSIAFRVVSVQWIHRSRFHSLQSSLKVSLSRCATHALNPDNRSPLDMLPADFCTIRGTTRSNGNPNGGWIRPASLITAFKYGRLRVSFQVTSSESRPSLQHRRVPTRVVEECPGASQVVEYCAKDDGGGVAACDDIRSRSCKDSPKRFNVLALY